MRWASIGRRWSACPPERRLPCSSPFVTRRERTRSRFSCRLPTRRTAPPSAFTRFMLERTVRSDFLYWLVLRIAPGVVVKTILATPPMVLAEASLAEQQRAARHGAHPAGPRAPARSAERRGDSTEPDR